MTASAAQSRCDQIDRTRKSSGPALQPPTFPLQPERRQHQRRIGDVAPRQPVDQFVKRQRRRIPLLGLGRLAKTPATSSGSSAKRHEEYRYSETAPGSGNIRPPFPAVPGSGQLLQPPRAVRAILGAFAGIDPPGDGFDLPRQGIATAHRSHAHLFDHQHPVAPGVIGQDGDGGASPEMKTSRWMTGLIAPSNRR